MEQVLQKNGDAISPQENLKSPPSNSEETSKNKKAKKAASSEANSKKKPRPFDISKSIDKSFRNALLKEKEPAEIVPLQLPEDWDPAIVAVGLAKNQSDITIVNMFREKIQSYENGEEKQTQNTKNHLKRTGTKKMMMKDQE